MSSVHCDKGQFCNKCDQSTVLLPLLWLVLVLLLNGCEDKKIVAVAVEIAVVTVTMSGDKQG